ncbi:MAG: hypothetical protein EBU26_16250 [Verrucomicrobia bacterium]|nr:hypothetical protein [Verrucomicrobiota bacterium]
MASVNQNIPAGGIRQAVWPSSKVREWFGSFARRNLFLRRGGMEFWKPMTVQAAQIVRNNERAMWRLLDRLAVSDCDHS